MDVDTKKSSFFVSKTSTKNNEVSDREKLVRENIFREGEKIDGTVIKGHDFNQGVDYSEIFKSFESVGFQASNLARAIKIVNKMISEKAFVYLGCTSNMISSGNREIIRYLVEHGKVNILVTTAGGVEEDIIKCLGDFVLGDFRALGKGLRDRGINRIGNIYVSNTEYVKFEKFLQPILKDFFEEQKKSGKIVSASELVWKLGERINDERSICYWAWKNKIKIYCPAVTDGALGDNISFFKYGNKDFKIDISDDINEINDSTFGKGKTGVILLGAGIVKHHILNANMFRNGANYAVYINNAGEFDGSDAGAVPEEAVSWGKLLPECERVKVFGDATILFPILVGETFAKLD
jgi:deoxyhypusine synthase